MKEQHGYIILIRQQTYIKILCHQALEGELWPGAQALPLLLLAWRSPLTSLSSSQLCRRHPLAKKDQKPEDNSIPWCSQWRSDSDRTPQGATGKYPGQPPARAGDSPLEQVWERCKESNKNMARNDLDVNTGTWPSDTSPNLTLTWCSVFCIDMITPILQMRTPRRRKRK